MIKDNTIFFISATELSKAKQGKNLLTYWLPRDTKTEDTTVSQFHSNKKCNAKLKLEI